MKTSLKTIAALVLSGMITQSALANTGGDSTQVNQSNQNSNTMTTATKTVRINGFDLNDIVSTVEAIQTDPSIAKFEFRAHNKWIQGGHNRSTIQGFYGGGQEDLSRKKPFVLDNSEPPILLGNNEGANPVEYILHGLAGCMTTTMVLHAAANNIQLESVESWLEGDLDVQGFLGLNDKVRNGYQQIRVTFTIKGDLKEEEKQKLESFVRMSPVYDIVTNKVPVVVKLQY